MSRVDIAVRIETGLTWEEDYLLLCIDTTLYKEIGDGIVTLYAEFEEDIPIIPLEIQKIRREVEEIKRRMTA